MVMITFNEIIVYLESNLQFIRLLALLTISLIVFFIIINLIKRALVKTIRTKKQKSNIKVFISLIKFLYVFFLLIIVVAYFYGNIGDLSFVAGLLTVAVGWALQKPITGVVGWLILTTRRPFDIGDRIIISGIKGDVTDITLTHIFLDEVGGTIDGEERSGRIVMIPTSFIFEKEIIDYTRRDDYILVDIVVSITYESNLEKAEKVILDSVKTIMESYWLKFPERIPKTPHIRLQFRESGIDVTVRYYTLILGRNQIATNIRREIFSQIRKTDDVHFAYPHRDVLLRNKTPP